MTSIPSPLVITGFHRSGTSLLAHYLGSCGLFLGRRVKPSELLECGSLSGHSEDEQIKSVLRDALAARQLWLYLVEQPDPPLELGEAATRRLREISRERPEREHWGFKTPAATLFLDPLGRVFPNAVFLFVVRDPMLSVGSLVRRNRDRHIVASPLMGFRSWLVYNRRILRFTEQHPDRCRVITLDDFLEFPQETVSTALDALGVRLETVSLEGIFQRRFLHLTLPSRVEKLVAEGPHPVRAAVEVHQKLVALARSGRAYSAARARQAWEKPRVG